MKKEMTALPNWIEPVLQGLAYWIGYRRLIQPSNRISDDSIISETVNLINSYLKKDESLILVEGNDSNVKELVPGFELDLAVYNREKLQIVIKVKSEEAGQKLIDQELVKLMEIKKDNPNLGCYLLLVSPARIPRNYVSEKGTAENFSYPIGNSKYLTKARRVSMAVSSFRGTAVLSANYACLIEVYF